jgi:glycosyltransferase involved in cell wall biosynthesis
MLKKVLIKGPVLSRSGYGEQARFALRSLLSRPDLFEIYIVNIPWGRTGQISAVDKESNFIHENIMKTQMFVQQGGKFDVSLQVTVPNEFEKIAPINIGYTAGIETTKVSPQWIAKSNDNVDKIIVVSNHSKKVFEQTKYDGKDQHGNEFKDWGLKVPVEVVNYPVRSFDQEEVNINFKTDNNFLVVAQWGPRKNLDNTIRWFVEAFHDNEEVGLVVKTNIASDSVIDRGATQGRLEALLSAYENRKCSVYLIHGEMSPGNLVWLYEHPTMKAMINIGHGEGYGLPLFEAAYHGLPLITTTWSGQMDFICKPNKKGKQVPRVIKVDYDIKQVQKEAVWNGIIQEDSKWAFVKEKHYKSALKDCLEKETHWKNQAAALKSHIIENFTKENMYNAFVESVYGEESQNQDKADMNKWLVDLEDEILEYE